MNAAKIEDARKRIAFRHKVTTGNVKSSGPGSYTNFWINHRDLGRPMKSGQDLYMTEHDVHREFYEIENTLYDGDYLWNQFCFLECNRALLSGMETVSLLPKPPKHTHVFIDIFKDDYHLMRVSKFLASKYFIGDGVAHCYGESPPIFYRAFKQWIIEASAISQSVAIWGAFKKMEADEQPGATFWILLPGPTKGSLEPRLLSTAPSYDEALMMAVEQIILMKMKIVS